MHKVLPVISEQSAGHLVALLKACALQKDLSRGSIIHAYIEKKGLLADNIFVGNSLVSMYAKCGALAKAKEVFDSLPVPNVVAWNSVIAGFSQYGNIKKAFDCFHHMQCESVLPNLITFICVLKACGSIGAIKKGKELHVQIAREGLLESNVVVGTVLVDMYGKCGTLAIAQQIFDELPHRDVVTWNALISGYADHGYGQEALTYFQCMQDNGFSPSAATFTCILKACTRIGATSKGEEIHTEIVQEGLLGKNLVVGNALIDMYSKGGAVIKAQELFDELPTRDVVGWNALITGYTQQGLCEEALSCYKLMQHENICADAVTFLPLLKACGALGAVHKGQDIHYKIVGKGLLRKNLSVGNSLIDMYAKCGCLLTTQEVFDELPVRDLISWNVLIACFNQHGFCTEALHHFDAMHHEGLSPNEVTFLSILGACGTTGAVDKGKQLHLYIAKECLLERNVLVATALVDMYAKCGALARAQEVFDELRVQSVGAWNALLAGYVQHGNFEEALNCFEVKQRGSLSPNRVTFLCMLKACGSIGALNKAKMIHSEIVRAGLLERNSMISAALVDMCTKSGVLDRGQELSDKLHCHNIYQCASMSELNVKSVKCEAASLGGSSLVRLLKTYGSMGAIEKGKELHAEIMRLGWLEKDISVGTALIDMYTKCGAIVEAQEVFSELPMRDVVTWSALIAGYAQCGNIQEALHTFECMQRKGITPDAVTFLSMLKGCSRGRAVEKGKHIHVEIAREGLFEHNTSIANALVDMYSKCGALTMAQEVFDDLSLRNVISWTSLMAGYAQYGYGAEALMCLEHMQWEGLCPNEVTYLCMVKVCGSLGALDKGKQIHEGIVKGAWLENDCSLGSALVDMYAKCGVLVEAQKVFDNLSDQSLILWNVLMAGYAQLGRDDTVLYSVHKMMEGGTMPNLATFTCLLNACSNSGQVDEGQRYYEVMITDFDVIPTLEHNTCMIDLYSRAGHFHGALAALERMASVDCCQVWSTFLGACRKGGNVNLAMLAFQHSIELDENDGAAYLCLSKIYTAAGMLDEAEKLDMMQVQNEAW